MHLWTLVRRLLADIRTSLDDGEYHLARRDARHRREKIGPYAETP